MNQRRLRVYVGCALTDAPPEFIKSIATLKDQLRHQTNLEILDFVGVGADRLTPRQVWNHDITDCVNVADAMIAICDYPSTGLGLEMGVAAVHRGIPLLALAQAGRRVTRLVLDIPLPKFQFQRYGDLSEVPGLFDWFIRPYLPGYLSDGVIINHDIPDRLIV